jgi:hypothetical protein
MKNKNSVDKYAVLSAIWILACNDDIPSMTYRGLQTRLNLPDSFDVRFLVRQHGELFRQRIPASWLEEWKGQMKSGHQVPSWIREKKGDERIALIDSLTRDDGFRSQFRTDPNAPRTDVAVIEWGLSHIERLRKAEAEAREATAKSWQMWLVFAVGVLGIIATIFAALLRPLPQPHTNEQKGPLKPASLIYSPNRCFSSSHVAP